MQANPIAPVFRQLGQKGALSSDMYGGDDQARCGKEEKDAGQNEVGTEIIFGIAECRRCDGSGKRCDQCRGGHDASEVLFTKKFGPRCRRDNAVECPVETA